MNDQIPSVDDVMAKVAESLTPHRVKILRQRALFGGTVSRDDIAGLCNLVRHLRAQLAEASTVTMAALADSFDEGWNAGNVATIEASDRIPACTPFTPEERLLIMAEAGVRLSNPYEARSDSDDAQEIEGVSGR